MLRQRALTQGDLVATEERSVDCIFHSSPGRITLEQHCHPWALPILLHGYLQVWGEGESIAFYHFRHCFLLSSHLKRILQQ